MCFKKITNTNISHQKDFTAEPSPDSRQWEGFTFVLEGFVFVQVGLDIQI